MPGPATSVMVTVYTTDGRQRVHTYPLDQPIGKLIEFILELSDKVTDAIRGKSSVLLMNHPMIWYKPDYIVSIEWNMIGPDELKKALEQSQRTLGFST